jgi:putative oxidoreductase
MFPDGWPGRALLLIHDGIVGLMAAPQRESIVVHVIATIAGILLLLGLWTPIAGVIIALSETWIALAGTDHPRGTILMATLGIALAILGPGALSIDARLFGRKRLDI